MSAVCPPMTLVGPPVALTNCLKEIFFLKKVRFCRGFSKFEKFTAYCIPTDSIHFVKLQHTLLSQDK